MPFRKKGSRTIVVDRVTYRWRIRGSPTHDHANRTRLAVQHAGNPGSDLIVYRVHSGPDRWTDIPGRAAIPALVERYIRVAIAQGWQPTAIAAPLILWDKGLSDSKSECLEPGSESVTPGL